MTRASKILTLGATGYLLGLATISGLYHKNDSFDVLVSRTYGYLQSSWVGFLIALALVGFIYQRRLYGARSGFVRLFHSLLAVHLVVFLTGLFFFVEQTMLKGSINNRGEFLDLLTYSVEQSWVGVTYCLPVSIVFSFLLARLVAKSRY